ncbi:hypothetical protein L873DRAFT_1793662 [Choiromyces venosus 120613-1]|uniref:Uncharacterized protein n=1 Tax=Choiromyces venosus 120613-1 TaxID=1336337 RepID=A0A3N4J837_9PEZI|nr:hypothetical protein L873DRAFT_1793662 [Choiromyces venosus 120613-1]
MRQGFFPLVLAFAALSASVLAAPTATDFTADLAQKTDDKQFSKRQDDFGYGDDDPWGYGGDSYDGGDVSPGFGEDFGGDFSGDMDGSFEKRQLSPRQEFYGDDDGLEFDEYEG